MSNNSASGGYLLPTTLPLPGGLTLLQFLQQVIVNLTGLPSTMVRPKWQAEPPKEPPEPTINWCAFGIIESDPDANAYIEGDANESSFQRHENLQLICSFYGPSSNENAALLRDSFQISQNRDVLSQGNIGFTTVGRSTFVPEFINNRWFPRTDIDVFLLRRVIRTVAIVPFESAKGIIETETIVIPWKATN